MIDLAEEFEKHEGEYGRFEHIENKLHQRRDICAFLLLEELAPVRDDPDMAIVSVAKRDAIVLATNPDTLAAIATSDNILTLVRCCVSYDPQQEMLYMRI